MAKRFSMYCDLALNAPIVVTKNGRDRLVMLGVDEYNFLKDLVQQSGQSAKIKSARPAAKSVAKPQVRAARKKTSDSTH